MLKRLEIHNYVLIDSLDIEFPKGLIIISGQTGAGKSILLGALSLLGGGKADSGVVSEGAENCIVEAEFEGVDPLLREKVEEAGAEWDESGNIIIRRVVSKAGRSRNFINDCPVGAPALSAVSSSLFDIHSQHGTLELQRPQYQTDLLDNFAGDLALRAEYAASYSKLCALRAEQKKISDSLESLKKERDFNEAQFRQLESAALREGELEELEQEQRSLANAEEIRELLSGASEAFTPSDEESPSVASRLKEAARSLEKVAAYIPAAGELAGRVESARMEIDDICAEVSSLCEKTDVSPERLETVESRMSLLYGLLQKFGCTTEAELIAEREKYAGMLSDTTSLDERLEEIGKEISAEQKNNDSLAEKLTQARKDAAAPFAAHIEEMIRSLEIPQALFSVEVGPADKPSALGRDSISFLFSSTGRNPIPVQKCASGGELSRIMLCLKAQMAHFTAMPTLIFDEIDTGVSGSVADKMGGMICEMGREMQVFAITHLPQVAAKGSAHYLVSKSVRPEDGKTVSTISRLGDKERVMEIARLLSGSTISDAAIANAKELLK